MSKKRKTWISLWTVYLIWGSTYFAIAYVIQTMPPVLGMGLRFLVATALLALFLLVKGEWRELRVSRDEFKTCSALGGVTIGAGNGGLAVAEAHVPTGIASLIIAALPLWISLFRTMAGERLSRRNWIGVAIGFFGAALLMKPGSVHPVSGASSTTLFIYMAIILIGNVSWALGTFLAPRYPLPKSALVLTVYQMFAGGLVLTLVGLLRGEKFGDFFDASLRSWLAFAYLVIFGSILGHSAYIWLVKNAPVGLTSTYAYVNPLIAVTLGALFLKEVITLNYAVGGLIIVIGVLAVVSSQNKSAAKSAD